MNTHTISNTLYRDSSVILSSLRSNDPIQSIMKLCKIDNRINAKSMNAMIKIVKNIDNYDVQLTYAMDVVEDTIQDYVKKYSSIISDIREAYISPYGIHNVQLDNIDKISKILGKYSDTELLKTLMGDNIEELFNNIHHMLVSMVLGKVIVIERSYPDDYQRAIIKPASLDMSCVKTLEQQLNNICKRRSFPTLLAQVSVDRMINNIVIDNELLGMLMLCYHDMNLIKYRAMCRAIERLCNTGEVSNIIPENSMVEVTELIEQLKSYYNMRQGLISKDIGIRSTKFAYTYGWNMYADKSRYAHDKWEEIVNKDLKYRITRMIMCIPMNRTSYVVE